MQSAQCNPHDACTMKSAHAIRTIQSAQCNPATRSHDGIRTCNPHDTICTMQSRDTITWWNPHNASAKGQKGILPKCQPKAKKPAMKAAKISQSSKWPISFKNTIKFKYTHVSKSNQVRQHSLWRGIGYSIYTVSRALISFLLTWKKCNQSIDLVLLLINIWNE